jgi:HAD superfamily hydrolase (TIGR01549 family)
MADNAILMKPTDPMIRPRGLLLDMDGTLTRPLLDFARIRADIGIVAGQPILESIAKMDDPRRAEAIAILDRHEEEAARESTLNEGAIELLEWTRWRGIGTALVTRNSRANVATVLARHGLRLDHAFSREDGPIKPDPRSLLLACDALGMGRDDVWMIGDGVHDIEAAQAAGIRSVWISHRQPRSFAAAPSRTVNDLVELLALLQSAQFADDRFDV